MKVFSKDRIIHVTKHGRKRLSERLTSDYYFKEMVKNAWESGRDLNSDEREYMFKKGIYNDNYWQSIYKKYLGNTYIYRFYGRKLLFITVI